MPVNMTSKPVARFSSDCSKLAMSTPDGRLTVWGSGGGGAKCDLLHQFSPSTHLTAVSTCLAWSGPSHPTKKKKRMSMDQQSDLVAMGTSAGTVLVYSIMQGDLVTTFKTENSTRITCLVWTKSANSLYAAGEDGTVSLFSIPKQCLVETIKHTQDPVFSLALNKDGSILAMGSRNIHIWDVSSKKVTKTVTGHANPVTRMEIAGNYLYSSSESERVVSVWDLEGKETSSVMTLGVNDEVKDLTIHVAADSTVTLAVVSSGGLVSILPGQAPSASITAKTIRVTSARGVARMVTAARIYMDSITIAYGEGMDMVMEQLDMENMDQDTCLVRESIVTKSGKTGGVTDLVTPRTDGQVVFLAPGSSLGRGQGKRKTAKEDDASLPVEDRVSLLSTQPSTTAVGAAPRTDTLAQLLAQGLHSNDTRILDSVLDRADLELIDNTVKRIPAEAVVPLVSVLQKYIKGRGMVNASHAKWLKAVLTIHTGYLVSVPDCQDLLSPVYALLETRTRHYNQVLQLRGKLELLTRQAMDRQGDTVVDTEKQALLVYQDESSDELEDVIDDLLVPGSDTDDDWEEKEDDEMEGGDESDDSVEIVNGENDDHDMDSESD
eukprot:TRINITY_DN2460_c0_g1_i2.p1 TRINITY_DN2460_c0_g1~~TRINITY_DN2460_c0_g1_i2.p1  ORF type:complete len:606 (-),score=281.26 TRINITY_DN2460_c0_g1_i2:53-1870(-)